MCSGFSSRSNYHTELFASHVSKIIAAKTRGVNKHREETMASYSLFCL